MSAVTGRPFKLVIDNGTDIRTRAFASLRSAVYELQRLHPGTQRFTWITEKRPPGQGRPIVHVRDGKPATEWAEVLMR